jgi:hypothetical protein
MDWTILMDGDELRKTLKAGDTGYWWVLNSTDLVSACGEEEAAEMSGSKRMLIMGELSLVPDRSQVSEEILKKVMDCSDWVEDIEDDEMWVDMAYMYGLRVLVNHAFGVTDESALKKALRGACVSLEGPVDHLLDMPVNKLGQTGHELLKQDLSSCLERASFAGSESPVLCRQVKQSNMSSECWLVQIWGLSYCKTCEVRGTAECGGQNIRKTGENEKGIKVPVP